MEFPSGPSLPNPRVSNGHPNEPEHRLLLRQRILASSSSHRPSHTCANSWPSSLASRNMASTSCGSRRSAPTRRPPESPMPRLRPGGGQTAWRDRAHHGHAAQGQRRASELPRFLRRYLLNIGRRVIGMVVDGVSDVITLISEQLCALPEFNSVIQSNHRWPSTRSKTAFCS
jgi:hypothetical protein